VRAKQSVRACSRLMLGAEAAVGCALGAAAVAAGAPWIAAATAVAATALGARAAALGCLARKAARESGAKGIAWPRRKPQEWAGFAARGVGVAAKLQWIQMPWARAWSASAQIDQAQGISGPLVIICPGYACSASPLAEWKKALSARGFCVCSFEYSTALGSIEVHAKELAEFCAMASARLGREPWLVGHSMGGLVCIQAALMGARALGVMTVGSPLEGTLRAGGAQGGAGAQMAYQSLWLGHLKQEWLSAPRAPLHCAWSSSDQIISPNTSADGSLWKARSSTRWDGLGHLEMLSAAAAARMALDFSNFAREKSN
jgi:pimeloyl-ACP methyl ester carboxylesterase